nr:MAG TPA: hypothetical protein [Caudoviricetes sp.]
MTAPPPARPAAPLGLSCQIAAIMPPPARSWFFPPQRCNSIVSLFVILSSYL